MHTQALPIRTELEPQHRNSLGAPCVLEEQQCCEMRDAEEGLEEAHGCAHRRAMGLCTVYTQVYAQVYAQVHSQYTVPARTLRFSKAQPREPFRSSRCLSPQGRWSRPWLLVPTPHPHPTGIQRQLPSDGFIRLRGCGGSESHQGPCAPQGETRDHQGLQSLLRESDISSMCCPLKSPLTDFYLLNFK